MKKQEPQAFDAGKFREGTLGSKGLCSNGMRCNRFSISEGPDKAVLMVRSLLYKSYIALCQPCFDRLQARPSGRPKFKPGNNLGGRGRYKPDPTEKPKSERVGLKAIPAFFFEEDRREQVMVALTPGQRGEILALAAGCGYEEALKRLGNPNS